jgi:hypothetical protein
MPPFDLVVGALLVMLAASDRFNTPLTNRSSTTAIRYHAAAWAYYALLLSTYVTVATSHQALGCLQRLVGRLPGGGPGASPILAAAFVLGALVPRMPVIAGIDEWVRRRLQSMASIPSEVRRLTAVIRRARFTPDAELQEHTRQFVEDLGIDRTLLDFRSGPDVRHAWTRLSVLRVVLDHWESNRRFAVFMSDFRTEVDTLKETYARMVAKARTALDLAGAPDGSGGAIDARHARAAGAYLADFKQQTMECAIGMMMLISRALLQCDVTWKARAADLKSIGYDVRQSDPALALDELLLVVFGAWVIMLFGFVSLQGFSASTSIEELLARTLMIAVIYGVAVGCALYEREHRSRDALGTTRPIVRYVAVALAAAVAGLIVSFWFHCAIFMSVTDAFDRLRVVYPWFVLTLLVSGLTAVFLDNQPSDRLGRTGLRALEATGMAIALMLAAVLVHAWLSQRCAKVANPRGYVVPPREGVLIISGIVGLFIGGCVPTWYRDARRLRSASATAVVPRAADGIPSAGEAA